MKRLATTCSAAAALVWGCTIYDVEGMALLLSKQTIVIGDTVSMLVYDRDGAMPPRSQVVWSSSDSTVAIIDETGLVRGIGPGVAQIGAVTGDYALHVPIKVWEPALLTTVAAGGRHTCGLTPDGVALCWGTNEQGQMGSRFASSRCEWVPNLTFPCNKSAIPVQTGLRFTAIASGHEHTCALDPEGAAHCWGANGSGQLGDTSSFPVRPAVLPVAGDHVFRSLEAADGGTCGLTPDDRLLCWGRSGSRILGDDDARSTPTEVAPELRFDRVATSGDHICGITTTGALWCWGSNQFGQLGVEAVGSTCAGGYACSSEPVQVLDAPSLDRVAVGPDFTCGVTSGGDAYCWGRNESGQLGDGTGMVGWQPRMVAGGHPFHGLAAGRDRACAVGMDGLWCWGRTRSNFGNGPDPDVVRPPPNRSVTFTALEPVTAAGGLELTEVSIGDEHSCGLTPDGLTWCWGWSGQGALGHGVTDLAFETAPLRVVLFDFSEVTGPNLPSGG